MNLGSTDMFRMIADALAQAAVAPQSVYMGVNPSTQQPEWASQDSPLGNTMRLLSDDLWKDEQFKEMVYRAVRDRVDKVADAMVATLAAKAITVERSRNGYGSDTYKVDPNLMAVLQDALAEELRKHPELLADRIDAETLAKAKIEIKITA